jgi:hypothetical protein
VYLQAVGRSSFSRHWLTACSSISIPSLHPTFSPDCCPSGCPSPGLLPPKCLLFLISDAAVGNTHMTRWPVLPASVAQRPLRPAVQHSRGLGSPSSSPSSSCLSFSSQPCSSAIMTRVKSVGAHHNLGHCGELFTRPLYKPRRGLELPGKTASGGREPILLLSP